MNKKKLFYILPPLILVVGFLLMMVLSSFSEEEQKRPAQQRTKIVEAEIVKLAENRSSIRVLGKVSSTQPIILTSEVTGIIERGSISFLPGQSFRKGDLLLKIDERQAELNLNSVKSDFLNSLASVLPDIKIDFPEQFDSWQNYFNSCGFNKNIPILPEASNQKIKLFLTRFNVYKNYFNVKNLEIILEKHFFYAPFNGTILTADLREGSSVRSGTKLGEVLNLDNLELEVPIPAQDVKWIDKSSPVILTSSELDGKWSGIIKRIGSSIDPQSQTIQAYISLIGSSKDLIFSGIYLSAEIPGLKIPMSYSVPRKAVYEEKYVYTVENGTLQKREINIIRRETNSVLVDGGLKNGDTLVVEIMQGIAPGMPAEANFSSVKSGDTK